MESKNSCTFARMFERLQRKWKVNSTQLFLVLCVFAIGGSATGYFGKVIMNSLLINKGWLWTLVYIVVITLIWPLSVLLVSIPFGQFSFFAQYLRRLGSRIGLFSPGTVSDAPVQANHSHPAVEIPKSPDNTNAIHKTNPAVPSTTIAIFASGTGSNARKIIDYFHNHPSIKVGLIACNKAGAGVLSIAEEEKIATVLLEKEKFFRGNAYVDELRRNGVNFIVLAGFLWKIPQPLINAFRNRIINIHPALLPKYGGKGMYGNMVHEAVIRAGEKESGITIHYVDEHYDNGDIIFQARVVISENETPESLAQKIHEMEHINYPRIIEQLVLKPNGS